MGCRICFLFCRTVESCPERGPSSACRGASVSPSVDPQGPSGREETSRAVLGTGPAASPGAVSTDGGNRGTGVHACGPSCCCRLVLQNFQNLNDPPGGGGCAGQSVVQMGKLRLSQEEAEQGSKLGCLESMCCSIQTHALPQCAGRAHICPCDFTEWLALPVDNDSPTSHPTPLSPGVPVVLVAPLDTF